MSPLRQGVVWPQSPRNFSTEPENEHSLQHYLNQIETDDFDFSCVFTLNGRPTTGSFYRIYQTNNDFGLLISSSTQLLIRTCGLYQFFYRTLDYTIEHSFQIEKSGGIVYFYFDGSLVGQAASTAAVYASDLIYTNHDGTIVQAKLKTPETVFVYPSESERLHLITYVNVRTDRNCFEAVKSGSSWSIKTAASNTTGTAVAKLNGVIVANPSGWNATTGIFTGSATDVLDWLLVYNRILSAAEIAAFN